MEFLISKQTEAENDKFLISCFYDANFISKLLDEDLSIISGRKGTGKTALAKYLQHKHKEHNIFFSSRISIDEISCVNDINYSVDLISFYIIICSVKLLMKEECFKNELRQYWDDFF